MVNHPTERIARNTRPTSLRDTDAVVALNNPELNIIRITRASAARAAQNTEDMSANMSKETTPEKQRLRKENAQMQSELAELRSVIQLMKEQMASRTPARTNPEPDLVQPRQTTTESDTLTANTIIPYAKSAKIPDPAIFSNNKEIRYKD